MLLAKHHLSGLPVAVAFGVFLIAPSAAAQESASPAQCADEVATSAAAGAPRAVSHDLRTNVVARANTSSVPSALRDFH